MKLRAIASVLSALVACGLVGYVVADPMTSVEAVPDIQPTSSLSPPADPTRAVDGPRVAVYSEEGATGASQHVLDPLNAVTPEAVGPSGSPVPLPTAPATIKKETVKPLGKAAAGALLTRPVNGRTTSKFGMRFHPILRVWKLHTGLDWAVPCGTPVGAAQAGTVVKAGWAGGNGIQVKVDHGMLRGYRVVTTYNHLSSIGVRVGQKVEALDGVGRVGSTGYSTGCHMHFEVIVNGQFTDPEPWLNGDPVVIDLSSMQHTSVPKPSASATPSVTPTPSKSPSPTPTPRVTPSPAKTPSPTPTPTPPSPTGTQTPPSPTTPSPGTTPAVTPSGTGSPTATPTTDASATASASSTPTTTGSPTAGSTETSTPTQTSTATETSTATQATTASETGKASETAVAEEAPTGTDSPAA
ncbi:hypothetical protein BW730_14625 [Tessaracoccus aquimaris]|uniref:M23ase beta-sheet core domain-containing protein n=2 Tax=Tessaracoccus aquimaris TaxID=1332264 RepID=A0A1Q2CR21_9ACTN|nr:hypothetical protein BW730_14625 [Tessaracoccus aquimaris]